MQKSTKNPPTKAEFGVENLNKRELESEKKRLTPTAIDYKNFVTPIAITAGFLIAFIWATAEGHNVIEEFSDEPFESLAIVVVLSLIIWFPLFLYGESEVAERHFAPNPSSDPERLQKIQASLDKIYEYEQAVDQYEEAKTHRRYFESAANQYYWSPLRGVALEVETAKFFQRLGWSVSGTPTVGDGGVDLILRKQQATVFIQCKGLKSKVSVATVRDAAGVKARYKPDRFIIVAPNGFTSGSIEFAKASRIGLADWRFFEKMAKDRLKEIQ